MVPSFISRGAPHQAAREASTSEGRKLNTRILPGPRNLLQALGFFSHAPNLGHGADYLTSPLKEGMLMILHQKNPTASAGFEPANSGTTETVYRMVVLGVNIFALFVIYQSILFPVALRPNAGHGLLIPEVSR
jgi:hypothetical protein